MEGKILLLFLVLFSIFIFQPISVIVLCILFVLIIKNEYSNNLSLLFLVIISIFFLSTLNATKFEESDLIGYVDRFRNSSKFGFFSYIESLNKQSECVYGAYEWIISHFVSTNGDVFKFATTSIEYYFLVLATYRYGIGIGCNKNILFLSILITLFNPYFFSLSLHLIRQCLAVSIFMYVMVNRCIYNKTNWLLLITCPLIHNMTIILVILLFLPVLGKPINKNLFAYSMIFVGLIFIKLICDFFLNSFFTMDSVTSYALRRASQDDYGEGSASIFSIGLDLCILLSSLYCGHISKKLQFKKHALGLRRICNVSLIISFFVIINVNNGILFLRFLMLLYPFISLLFLSLFKNVRLSNITSVFFSLVLLNIFLYLTINNVWTYQGINEYLLSGILAFS